MSAVAPADAITGRSPGKVILLGEHAVVYGHPALAAPFRFGVSARAIPADAPSIDTPEGIDADAGASLQRAFLRAARLAGNPKVRVSLHSELPVSVGLGSSAAVAVACARALLAAQGKREPAVAEVTALALEMEREFHGTPSGVDHTVCAMNDLIEYQRPEGNNPGKVRVVKCPKAIKLVVAIAGQRSGTKATVAALRERGKLWPARYHRLYEEIARVVQDGVRAVEQGDLAELGDAMNVNHGLLSALQLSSSPIDGMVYRLRALGAFGAKLTGAGGDGGAVIGLFLNPAPVVEQLRREQVTAFEAQVAGPEAK